MSRRRCEWVVPGPLVLFVAWGCGGGEMGPQATTPVTRPVWEFEVERCRAVEVLDDDRDGTLEVLVCGLGSGTVLDGGGKREREFPVALGITQLRAASGGPGDAVLAGFSNWKPDLFLHPGGGKLRTTFRSGRFPGIDEVRPFDLDGDGTDEFLVGYNGGGGIRAILANGRVLWHTEEVGNVWNLDGAILGPDAARRVVAVHARGTIVVFGADGRRVDEWRPGRYCNDVFAADLDGDGRSEVAAIGKTGGLFWNRKDSLYGLGDGGEVRWVVELPGGSGNWRQRRHAAGKFVGQGEKQWAVACDGGSVVVVDRDGRRCGEVRSARQVLDLAALPRPDGDLLLVATSSGVAAYDGESLRR